MSARRTATILVLAALAGCGPLERGGQVSAVGAILPLSGPEARSGECVLEGMRLAAERTGPPLEILARDGYGSTGSALRRLTELTDQPSVLAVAGGWRAAAGRPLAAAAAARGMPFVALSPLAAPDVAARGPRGLHRVAALGAAGARFAREDLGAKAAGVVRASGSDAAAILSSSFLRTFQANGGQVRWTVETDTEGNVAVPPGAEPVDVVWVAGPGSLVSRFASAVPGVHGASFVLPEGWAWEGLDALASGNRIYVVAWYSAGDPDPHTQQLIEACNAAGIVPTPAHALGWDFVNAVREAAADENASREGVSRAFGGPATFDGSTGRLALGGGPETPAVSQVTNDGVRFIRRVGADASPAAESGSAQRAGA